jgi:MFS family permease
VISPLPRWEFLVAVCGFASATLYGFHSTLPDLPRPFAIADFGSDKYRFQWVSGVSNVGTLATMAAMPWLLARFGLRLCFLSGLFFYACGNLAGIWVREDTVYAATTLITAVGNGLIVTTVLNLMWREFPGHHDWSIALYVVGLYLGRILGPSVTGVLVNEPNWRTVLAVPAVVAGVLLVIAYESFRDDEPASTAPHPPRFDFPGWGLLIGWVTCLYIGLSRFQLWGWDAADAPAVVYAAGVLMFAAFLARQLTAAHPLFDLSLLRNKRFTLAVLIKATADATLTVVLLIVAQYMVIDRAYPRTTAGLVLLPSIVSMLLALLVTARFGHRANRKVRLVVGMAGLAISTWLLSGVDLFTDKRWLAAVLAFWAWSAGIAGSPVVCINFEGLTQTQVVASAAIKNVMRVLPTMVGVGIFGILGEYRTAAAFDLERQTLEPNRPPVADVSAWVQWHLAPFSRLPSDLPEQTNGVLGSWVRANSHVWATQAVIGWFAVLAGAGAVMSLFLRPLPLDAPGPLRG